MDQVNKENSFNDHSKCSIKTDKHSDIYQNDNIITSKVLDVTSNNEFHSKEYCNTDNRNFNLENCSNILNDNLNPFNAVYIGKPPVNIAFSNKHTRDNSSITLISDKNSNSNLVYSPALKEKVELLKNNHYVKDSTSNKDIKVANLSENKHKIKKDLEQIIKNKKMNEYVPNKSNSVLTLTKLLEAHMSSKNIRILINNIIL